MEVLATGYMEGEIEADLLLARSGSVSRAPSSLCTQLRPT